MNIEQYQQVWEIWKNHQDALAAYVIKITGSTENAEDITQEVLIKVHKSCCSEIEIKNLRSWLFQIAYNATLDFHKQRKTAHLPLQGVAPEKDIYQELSVYLEPLIDFLPSKYALPLRLSDVRGMKQQDVADKLNISLTATKSRIQRARKMLKDEIHTCFHLKECSSSGLMDFELKTSCQPLQNWHKENS